MKIKFVERSQALLTITVNMQECVVKKKRKKEKKTMRSRNF